MLHDAEFSKREYLLEFASLSCVFFKNAGRETSLINRFYKGLCILAANCQLQFFAA